MFRIPNWLSPKKYTYDSIRPQIVEEPKIEEPKVEEPKKIKKPKTQDNERI